MTEYITKRVRGWQTPLLILGWLATIAGCALLWNSTDEMWADERTRHYREALFFLVPLFVLISHIVERPHAWIAAFGIFFFAAPWPMADAKYLNNWDREYGSRERRNLAGQILMVVGSGLTLLCFPFPAYRFYDDDRNAVSMTSTDGGTTVVDRDRERGTTVIDRSREKTVVTAFSDKDVTYYGWSRFSPVSIILFCIVAAGSALFFHLISHMDPPYYALYEFNLGFRCLLVACIFLLADFGSRTGQILLPFLAGFMFIVLDYCVNPPSDDRRTQRRAAGALCFGGMFLMVLYIIYWTTLKDDDREDSDLYYGYYYRRQRRVATTNNNARY